ncbi:hypothetical protein GCM10023115_48600 [Pontixanthobacter gangjinensis]|uniref:Uncharacterized protein n=1 Tax=Christiangramia aestuarii TaxID=1028746 RepID=A0A7M3SWR9_9FLAO|nr:hypothetical protein [Christiangramia aestuarii]MUP41050.1 hypothetical protein [Christiangramia aestuarii]
MRKLLLVSLLVFAGACSVENDSIPSEEIKEVNAMTMVDGCSVYDLKLGQDGIIRFRNFYDYLEVTVTNVGNTSMNAVSIHFTKDSNDFPRTGKGDLNTSKFTYSENVNKGVNEVTLRFEFSELGVAVGDDLFITAAAEFGSGKNKRVIFVQDEELVGTSFYFTYHVEKFLYYAGTDQVREIYLSDAQAVPSWDEVRKLYANMLDPGVPKKAGVYSPSIWDIIYDFNDPNRETKIDDYTTTYTLGTGECSDSVELTLRVVPDPL